MEQVTRGQARYGLFPAAHEVGESHTVQVATSEVGHLPADSFELAIKRGIALTLA